MGGATSLICARYCESRTENCGSGQKAAAGWDALDLRQSAVYIVGILPILQTGRYQMQATQPVVETVFRKLGGREVFGQKVTSEADLARLVNNRIPLRALIYVKRGGFSDREIGQFIIPERTQRHRKAKRQPLTIEESDRVVRLTRIQALSEDVFGDSEKANRWLREGLAILDGKPPLDVARTESGARVVEQILAKIDWGAAA
jgi:putative toxin-antitoxin system antitoxin component (TIGR02293 family)